MKSLFWFLMGVAAGAVAAHFVNKDPRGHEVLAQVDARITEFTDRIGAAYREQEARFAGAPQASVDAGADAPGPVAAASETPESDKTAD